MNNTKKTPGRIAFESFRDALKIPSKTFIWDDVQTKQAYEAAAFAVLTSQWRPMTEPPANDHHVIVVSDDYTDCQAVLFSLHGQTRRFWMDVPPLPQEPTDPYAELKAAHAAGKVIQLADGLGGWDDVPCPMFDIGAAPDQYRIKPWTLSRHLPGFRPLEPGEEWHRSKDWTESLLPDGYRPLLAGETREPEDENQPSGGYGFSKHSEHILSGFWRTRRPLPPTKQELDRKEFEEWAFNAGYGCSSQQIRDTLFIGWQAARATAKPNP